MLKFSFSDLWIPSALVMVAVPIYKLTKSSQKDTQELLSKAQSKREQVRVSIEMTANWEVPSEEAQSLVLNSDMSTVHSLVIQKKVTGREVFLTSMKKLREEGLDWVSDIDPSIVPLNTGDLAGALVGVQDSVSVKGMTSSFGAGVFAYNVQHKDAPLIKVMRESGAVLLLKTPSPQCDRSFEFANNISGNIPNSEFPDKVGSEGELLRKGCLNLIVSTDVLGTLRYSALASRVLSFKPSSKRISSDLGSASQDLPLLKKNIGVLAKSVNDIRKWAEVVISQPLFEADPKIVPLAWNNEVYSSQTPMTVGYFESEEFWEVSESMKRAVKQAVQKLQSKGHKVVPIQMPSLEQVSKVILSLIAFDSQPESRLGKEQYLGYFTQLTSALKTNKLVRYFKKKYTQWKSGTKELLPYEVASRSQCYEYLLNMIEGINFKQSFYELWNTNELDALIAPFPFPVLKQGASRDSYLGFGYLSVFNLLDCCVGSALCGDVTEEFENIGLGTAVQVVTLPYQEEQCLKLMAQLS